MRLVQDIYMQRHRAESPIEERVSKRPLRAPAPQVQQVEAHPPLPASPREESLSLFLHIYVSTVTCLLPASWGITYLFLLLPIISVSLLRTSSALNLQLKPIFPLLVPGVWNSPTCFAYGSRELVQVKRQIMAVSAVQPSGLHVPLSRKELLGSQAAP